jgi:heme/copper-type cytochrome/quinol oxidase subunit 2
MQYLAEAEAHFVPPFPTFVYGAIAMVVFVVLGFVTWSYRDVANRHEHKSNSSKGHH